MAGDLQPKNAQLVRCARNHKDYLAEKGMRRVIQNYCGYKLPGREFQETEVAVESAEVQIGNLVSMKQSIRAPLQCSIGDASNPDFQCAASACLSEDPNVSVTMRPLDVLSSRLVDVEGGAKFPGVWHKATKIYKPAPNKLMGALRLDDLGHDDVFRYALDVPDGMSIEIADNRVSILDSEGVERLHMPAPMAWDSSSVNPETMDGRKPIRVTLREGNPVRINGRDCQVIELELNRDDLAGATYPVDVDPNPTVQITGTTDIEDNYLASNTLANSNYGNATTLFMRPPGATTEQRPLIRILAGNIPAGTIAAFKLFTYSPYNTAGTIYAYFVADANDWVEGTATGAVQSGSSCWNQCKKDAQNWAGHPTLGCYVSGTDYDADASPPSMTFDATYNKWRQFDLKPEWPPLWRDAARATNGLIFSLPGAGQQYRMQSSEHGTYPLYFEIDYSAPTGGAAQRFLMMGGK